MACCAVVTKLADTVVVVVTYALFRYGSYMILFHSPTPRGLFTSPKS